jgi:arsenate reductase (glutaredoxin)
MATVYTYKNCSTCRAAKDYLRSHAITFEEKSIRDTPPSEEELQRMLAFYQGDLRRLFNTSGKDYRALKLKDRLPSMTVSDCISLLSTNGNLIKRPFLLTSTSGRAGFKEAEWNELFAG